MAHAGDSEADVVRVVVVEALSTAYIEGHCKMFAEVPCFAVVPLDPVVSFGTAVI